MRDKVLLDTSFFIRFLNPADVLFRNADGYFRYFAENSIQMYISTISIAEFCAGGDISYLPLKNLIVLPFNFNHAEYAGKLASLLFKARKQKQIEIQDRLLIPNDTKLLSQAATEINMKYFVTSDSRSYEMYQLINKTETLPFSFIDLKTPPHETFSYLNLE